VHALGEGVSEPPDSGRLPHRDPGHDQDGEDGEADDGLELRLQGRVQVADQQERGGQMDKALHSALLSGGHGLSSRTTL
jgi:hypothetical protein